MAHKVLLLSLPESQQPASIRNAFTKAERDTIREGIACIPDTKDELQSRDSVWNKTLDSEIERACQLAFDWLDMKADIVVTTTSAATEHRFSLHRQPHSIGIEEVSRLDDAELMTFFSQYHSAHARICVGDHRQLGVQLFGEKSANPFYHQVKYTFLRRLMDTGFKVPNLVLTERFGNEELLQIVRCINGDDSIAMREGAARDDASQLVRDIHKKMYPALGNINTTALFLDYPGSEDSCLTGAGQSWFNSSTALVAIDHIRTLIDNGIPGADIVLTSCYRTQTDLHSRLLKAAAKAALPSQSKHLVAVRCSTVDSYMGEESPYHVHDTCSLTGHAWLEPSRSVVQYSRAAIEYTIIGSTRALSTLNKFRYDHVCKLTINDMILKKRRVELAKAYTNSLPTYNTTIGGLRG
jgi:hypothetical protein